MLTEKELTLGPLAQETLRHLLRVWLDFERRLSQVPIIRRLEQKNFTPEDYRRLLLNLRPQVVEGSRWIARAASSFTAENSEIRSIVLRHAVDEHRDYTMLERDFVAAGGTIEEIQQAQRNIGTEALAGYLMNEASKQNPIQLLGAMFIIEGLGNKMASRWAGLIQECLNVDSATTFLSYHGVNDDSHMDKFYRLLDKELLAKESADQIVKTAKVVARLYLLQLEELDNV